MALTFMGALGVYLVYQLRCEFGCRIYAHIKSVFIYLTPLARRKLFLWIGAVDGISGFLNKNLRNDCM
ncbi:hypothetical protein NPX99_01345 [Bartonella sp. 220]|nr:hypothetical protein [Bartonella sp. 220B]